MGYGLLSLLLSPLIGILVLLIAGRKPEALEHRAIEKGTMQRCPFCAEVIRREAVVCRFCGRNLRLPVETPESAGAVVVEGQETKIRRMPNAVAEVKRVVRTLLDTLKQEKLVLDWRKRQQSRQAVRLCIEQVLDTLPPVYATDIYLRKCDLAYQHVYDAYFGEGRSIYASAA